MDRVMILIDSRERDMWDALVSPVGVKKEGLLRTVQHNHVKKTVENIQEMLPYLERRMLPIGDVWIVRQSLVSSDDDATADPVVEETILMILERKTVSDLWSSVRDGRYHEQHDRVVQFALEEGTKPFRYMRVIEGSCPTLSTHLHAIPYETFFHICLRTYDHENIEKVETIRTVNMNETVMLLQTLWRQHLRLTGADDDENHRDDLFPDADKKPIVPSTDERMWKSLRHGKKITAPTRKNNITPTFLLAASLSIVPQMSFATAEKIAQHFQNFHTFTHSFIHNKSQWTDTILSKMTRPSKLLVQRTQSLFFPEQDLKT